MLKLILAYDRYAPWAICGLFVVLSITQLFIDYREVGIYIAATIGWASYLQVRSEYESLQNMIMGITKDDTQG